MLFQKKNMDISQLVFIKASYTILPITISIFSMGLILGKPNWVFWHFPFLLALIVVTIKMGKALPDRRFPKLLLSFTIYYIATLLWLTGVNQNSQGSSVALLIGLITIILFPGYALIANLFNIAFISVLTMYTNVELNTNGTLSNAPKIEFVIIYILILGAGNSLISILMATYHEDRRRISGELEQASMLATIDPLTGLANKRFITHRVAELVSGSKRTEITLSLIMIDIDHFKQINDTFGHVVGDKVLVKVAHCIKEVVRDDLVGRFGGEEFIVVLKDLNLKLSKSIAERIRIHIENESMAEINPNLQGISASLGVAMVDVGHDLLEAVQNADAALYEAKRGGRNKVAVYASPSGEANADSENIRG